MIQQHMGLLNRLNDQWEQKSVCAGEEAEKDWENFHIYLFNEI